MWPSSVLATERVGAEMQRQGVTARTWTREDLMSTSDFKTPALEKKSGRLRAAFVAPFVSEETVALKALRRLRPVRGPLLVECGR